MQNRVFIYIRVSTQEQATEGYSLGEQEERLKKYCDAMGWMIVDVYKDGGFSGGNLDRPALKSMIREIEKGSADIVLVDKLDRLSRSQFDTLYLIQEVFGKHNVSFVSRAESFDTSTPFGRAMIGILAVFAELERERIKERMSDGREGRSKEGKWKGGNVPTGYSYNQNTGFLVINDYEAEQVKMVIDMFNKRFPIHSIMTEMNAKGYRTKYGEWSEGTIKRVVSSRLYLGEMMYHKKWIPAGHPAINTLEAWNRSQAILKERDKEFERYRPGRRYASPLAGLIRCGVCGGKYHCRTVGRNKDGSLRHYYMCYSRAKTDKKMVVDPNCKNKNYRDRDLEAIIYAEIRKLKSDTLYIDDLRSSIDMTAVMTTSEKRILSIEKQISKLMDLYTIGTIDLNVIKEKVTNLSNEKKSLEDEIDKMKSAETLQLSKKEIQSLVDIFENVVTAGDNAQINNVISELIQYITIENEDIKIHWNF